MTDQTITQQNMHSRARWRHGYVGALLCLLGMTLACAAQATTMTVEGTPRAICPSSTARPTHTMLPPDPPFYPPFFEANLNYNYVDPSRGFVVLQYLAQNAGEIRLYVSGWSAPLVIASTGTGPGIIAAQPIVIPYGPVTTTISVSSNLRTMVFTVSRYSTVFYSNPTPAPCCLPGPVYPPARPTYTPWPTPTRYQVQAPQDFLLNMPVHNDSGPVRLRLVLKSIAHKNFPILPLVTAATWELEVTNVGSVEFDFIGSLQTYVSQVDWFGNEVNAVWSPSHQAAEFMGIVEQAYNPFALLPGRSITIRVAAWIPAASQVRKVSFILNPYQAGDPGFATFVPGQERLITWLNKADSDCPAW